MAAADHEVVNAVMLIMHKLKTRRKHRKLFLFFSFPTVICQRSAVIKRP